MQAAQSFCECVKDRRAYLLISLKPSPFLAQKKIHKLPYRIYESFTTARLTQCNANEKRKCYECVIVCPL